MNPGKGKAEGQTGSSVQSARPCRPVLPAVGRCDPTEEALRGGRDGPDRERRLEHRHGPSRPGGWGWGPGCERTARLHIHTRTAGPEHGHSGPGEPPGLGRGDGAWQPRSVPGATAALAAEAHIHASQGPHHITVPVASSCS